MDGHFARILVPGQHGQVVGQRAEISVGLTHAVEAHIPVVAHQVSCLLGIPGGKAVAILAGHPVGKGCDGAGGDDVALALVAVAEAEVVAAGSEGVCHRTADIAVEGVLGKVEAGHVGENQRDLGQALDVGLEVAGAVVPHAVAVPAAGRGAGGPELVDVLHHGLGIGHVGVAIHGESGLEVKAAVDLPEVVVKYHALLGMLAAAAGDFLVEYTEATVYEALHIAALAGGETVVEGVVYGSVCPYDVGAHKVVAVKEDAVACGMGEHGLEEVDEAVGILLVLGEGPGGVETGDVFIQGRVVAVLAGEVGGKVFGKCLVGTAQELGILGVLGDVAAGIVDQAVDIAGHARQLLGQALLKHLVLGGDKLGLGAGDLEVECLAPVAGGACGIDIAHTPVPLAGVEAAVGIVHVPGGGLALDGGLGGKVGRGRQLKLEILGGLHRLGYQQRAGIDVNLVARAGICHGAVFLVVLRGIGHLGSLLYLTGSLGGRHHGIVVGAGGEGHRGESYRKEMLGHGW